MDGGRAGWRTLAVLVALAAFASVARAQDRKPFPTRASVILGDGATYVVEGRQTIGWGMEISVQKGIRIVGSGADSVLVVEGSLQIHGIAGQEVVIEDLVIEPGTRFQEIRLDTVLFRSGGVKTGPVPSSGKIVVENTDFARGVKLDVTLTGGSVELRNAMIMDPVVLRGAPPEGKQRSIAAADLNGCYYKTSGRDGNRSAYSGLMGGLQVEGMRDVVVRNCRLAGDLALFVDCEELTFDGNKVDVARLEFRRSEAGGFRRTKIGKCDVYSREVVFVAPADRKDRVVMDKCWFLDRTDPREIHEAVIRDATDDDGCGVSVRLTKVLDRPLELAGKRSGG